jgi:hypothetical protein
MAIYPGANVRLIDTSYLSGRSMAVYNRVNLHVQAGTGSLYGFFNQSGRASSHFWVSYGGTVEQYVDTKLQAEADLDGNDATISIETEGGTGSTADVDGWTEAQLAAIAGIVRWAMDTHGIPRKLADNAFSGNDSSKGLSWHRLGIDGNFPALPDIRAGRKQRGGGMYYSSSTGKVCPGGGKIQQIPGILDRVNGGAGTTPPPLPPEGSTGGLVVDGQWGAATTRALQTLLGTTVDGVISHQWRQDGVNYPGLFSAQWDKTQTGSNLIRAIQGVLGIAQDGLCGRDTISAIQARMGTQVDGVISTPYSNMVAEMQRRLNTGDAATS